MQSEGQPLLADGEDAAAERRPQPCRSTTLLLLMSLLVNALAMSAIMTEEMEHSAQHLVATKAAQQLRAVPAAPARRAHPEIPSVAVRSGTALGAPGVVPLPARAAAVAEHAPLADSTAALAHKHHGAVRALARTHVDRQHSTQRKFNIDRFRLALLQRREAREAGHKPSVPLRPPLQLRGSEQKNPNEQPAQLVDSRGAFFDPKLDALVSAELLGTRAASRNQEAKLLAAEHTAAEVFLPQLMHLQTEDRDGRIVTVKENEAQQLASGLCLSGPLFCWYLHVCLWLHA